LESVEDDLAALCRSRLEAEDRPFRIVVHHSDAVPTAAKERALLGALLDR
ncbi:MAG: hypothetical protein JOZ24_10805, partial [Candidatus Eremiobacteraeota bacterium]|nr:hypothetical protein [Candidatus Eremiobacteraeota bacterium]